MQLAGVRRQSEIVFRREPEMLGRKIELFEQPALRRETVRRRTLVNPKKAVEAATAKQG